MADLSRRTALSGGVALLAGTSGGLSKEAEGESCEYAPPQGVTAAADRSIGANTRFWCATGFSPAELLLMPEMRRYR